jgi:hypothetical protein
LLLVLQVLEIIFTFFTLNVWAEAASAPPAAAPPEAAPVDGVVPLVLG